MSDIGTLTNYTGGSTLYASQLNSDFGAIRTVVNGTVLHTDKASQTVTKTVTFTPDSGGAFVVSTGGATITAGGFTITAGGLTVTAGGVSVAAGTTSVQALECTTLTPSGTSTLQAVTCTTLDASTSITCTTFTASGTITITGASSAALAMSGGNATLYTPNGVTRLGAASVGTTDTAGFPVIPSCNGTPSGAATAGSLVFDSSNLRLYVRTVAGWKYATLN